MNNKITKQELRKFGLTVGTIFPLLLGLIIPLIRGHSFAEWTLFIGIPLFITGLFKPNFLLFPYKFWISLGHYLGWINSRLILGLVFIFVVQPISIFMDFFGYDPLRKKRAGKKSYRENIEHRKIDLTRIF